MRHEITTYYNDMKISQLTQLANPGPDVAIPVAAGSENFKVTLAQIAGACNRMGVVYFDGEATVTESQTGGDTLIPSEVVYDSREQRFYGRNKVNGQWVYYRNWKTMDMFMDENEFPRDDRLYCVCTGDGFGELYFVVDDYLRRAGLTEAEAERLKALETRVNELEQQLATLTGAAAASQTE